MKEGKSNIREERKDVAPRGCIKTTTGPWIVRRRSGNGMTSTSLRRPSQRERENNRERERHRRSVRKKIFAALRAHANYNLPKHSDHNDVLQALCDEAGWHIEEDGTIYRKRSATTPCISESEPIDQSQKQPREAPFCSWESNEVDELSLTLALPFQ